MDTKDKLDALHLESQAKLNELMETEIQLNEDQAERLQKAREEWQNAWAKLREVLMVLERLEI